jgi:hypothetical protein
MRYECRYNWRGDTVLGFHHPLVPGAKFVSQETGEAHLVLAVHKAREKWEHVGDFPPDEIVLTRLVG